MNTALNLGALVVSSATCGAILTLTVGNNEAPALKIALFLLTLAALSVILVRFNSTVSKLNTERKRLWKLVNEGIGTTEIDVLKDFYKSALDNTNANIMIADKDNSIIYMNSAADSLFKTQEKEIQKHLPDFDAYSLIGSSMDVFHKDPAHQKALIEALTKTYKSSAVIADITFSIIASPIFDSNGYRIGTVVEWEDISKEMLARRQAAANSRLSQALNCASANIMVADADDTIIYMNDTVRAMFTAAESDIREELQHFNVSTLIGQSMDIFHKNPDHQRNLIKNLTHTYVAPEVRVANRVLKITASPIFDDDRQRLGTVVEWEDITAEIAVEHEVNSIVESARKGDLGKRISVSDKSGFFRNLGEGINELVSVSDSVVEDVGKVFAALAEGDLRKRIETDYEGAFEDLKKNVNSTVERLIEVIGDIQQSSASVATGADEISKGNINLSQRTEEQSASLEETAASMEQMTASVQQNASNAAQASKLANEAHEKAELGGDVIGQAVVAMDGISQSSQEIEAIITVIDEIAFQTNLLALNASVEAARAGEKGRGFAVVADEVRTLAGRSADAAKEIKELIENSSLKVQDGSRLVHSSGKTLTEIIEAVNKVNTIVNEISEASAEQAGGIQEVNLAITQMDDMTQQNAALVEESAAAAESMSDQSDGLRRLVSFFTMP
ncbi:MAG: methyl-accepting chemotaxis protein [Pseudohongiellaceae bacterium]